MTSTFIPSRSLAGEDGNISSFVAETLVQSFQFFNEHLFDGELPDTYITIADINVGRSRRSHIAGFFKREEVKSEGSFKNTITLDSEYTGACVEQNDLRRLMSTLVHEMTHEWDWINNPEKQVKRGHGRTWRTKMSELGLEPVCRGNRWYTAGVSHEVVEHGIFSRVFDSFPQEIQDNYPLFSTHLIFVKRPPSTYTKQWFDYKCPICSKVQKLKGDDALATCSGGSLESLHKVVSFLHDGTIV